MSKSSLSQVAGSLQQQALRLLPDLKEIRHHLHRHPELSFEEYDTSAFLQRQLEELGIPVRSGLAGTGLVATIPGLNPDSGCIALRADMDALPITEENTHDFISQRPGIMHACGHDVHMTCLLGATRLLQAHRDQFEGTIKLIFQPGEEKSPGGASLMIRDGALDAPRPRAIYGLHVDPSLPAGVVGFRPGSYMASADEIHLKIKGKGGHAALPHLCIDPIPVAAEIILSLQQIVSRRSNPLIPSVLSFGKIEGGAATNVIPDTVELLGTFRTFDESWREEAKALIRNRVERIAAAHGAEAQLELPSGYPVLLNDIGLTTRARQAAGIYLGETAVRDLDLRMSSEDFSFYTHVIPGCFFRLGTNRENTAFTRPVHTPRFDIDESALSTGAGMLAWLAVSELRYI